MSVASARHRNRSIRHAMLTDLTTQIHVESHGIYGGRRVHAELPIGRGVAVGHNRVQLLKGRSGLTGNTGRGGGSGYIGRRNASISEVLMGRPAC